MLLLWWQNKAGAAPPPPPPPAAATGGWTHGRKGKRRRGAYDFLGPVPTAEEIREARRAPGQEAQDRRGSDSVEAQGARLADRAALFEKESFAKLQAQLDAIRAPDERYERAKRIALDPELLERMEAADAMLIAFILASLD